MLIHLVTDRFSVGGGIEHIFQIVKGMPGFQFGIYGLPGPAAARFEDLPNARVFDRGYGPGYVLEEKPDLVHIHHLRPLVSFFNRPFKKYPAPIIYTAHGLHIHKYEFFPGLAARLKYNLRFRLEKNILKKPRRVIAVSREDREFMQDRYGLDNVEYLTNGIDFSAINAVTGSRDSLREELGLPKATFLFITVARFNFQKGYDILLDALRMVGDKFGQAGSREVKFIFVGEGEDYKAMKEKCRDLALTPFVEFLGERNDVYKILKAGDMFLLPSRWEGLPIVLIEAGRIKIPVLASDTYGNREIAGQGRGVLFKTGDSKDLAGKISAVQDNHYDLDTLSQNLYQEVTDHYNLPNMLTRLQSLYRSFSME